MRKIHKKAIKMLSKTVDINFTLFCVLSKEILSELRELSIFITIFVFGKGWGSTRSLY